jgi:hypothetical protein
VATGRNNIWLEYVDAICVSIQGFLNALVWLSDPYFRARIRQAPFCLALMYCSLSRKHLKEQQSAARETALLNESEGFGPHSLRKAVVTHLMMGLAHSVQRSGRSYQVEKEFATEDFEDELHITNLTQMMSTNTSVSLIFEKRANQSASFFSYSSHVFQRLRELDGITNEAFLGSFDVDSVLAAFETQKFSEGRSGSFFIFSPDQRFIMKTVPVNEAMLLRRILKAYYLHICKHPGTLLSKCYGIYSFHSGFSPAVYAIVMNNVFYSGLPIHQRYDLKGSWVRREVGLRHQQDPSSVLGMDQDFVRTHSKIEIGPRRKGEIMSSLETDSLFLKNLGIIDYSLLVGLHFREGPPNPSGGQRL